MLNRIKRHKYLLLILLGILSEICFLYFLFTQNSDKNIPTYIWIYASTALFCYIGYFMIVKRFFAPNEKKVRIPLIYTELRYSLLIILLFGMLFRITLIPSSPSTSDDVYRYIWEGKIITNGYNPFQLSPDSKKLEKLHSDKLPKMVTYPGMTTIYPPAAQLTFAAGYVLSGENDTGLKIIYLLAELITFIFILKILRYKELDENLIILYAWFPLPIMEFFINSHIDVVGITFFVMFIYFFIRGKHRISAVTFTISVLVKLYPLILFPLFFKKMGFKKTIYMAAVILLVTIIFMAPFIPKERSVNASLFTYLSNWSFNGSVYTFLKNIVSDENSVRLMLLGLFIVSVSVISIKYNDFLKAVYAVWICFIIFAATLYPWYFGWIAAINPAFNFLSVSSLLFTVNASNFTPLGEVWKEYTWVYLVEYIPFYSFLIYELVKLFNNKSRIDEIKKN